MLYNIYIARLAREVDLKQSIAVEMTEGALRLTTNLWEHMETAPAIGPSPVVISSETPLLEVAQAFNSMREMGMPIAMPGVNGRFTMARAELPPPRLRSH